MKNITDIIQLIHILFSIIEKGINIAKEFLKKSKKNPKTKEVSEISKKQPSDREA